MDKKTVNTGIEAKNDKNWNSNNNVLSIDEIKKLSIKENESVFEYEKNKLKDYFENELFDIENDEFFNEINRFRKQKNVCNTENKDNKRWELLN